MMLYGEMRDWQPPATGEAEPYGLREQHALVVRGQTILAIIPESEIPSGHCQCVDLDGRLVTPGLIDCHTHPGVRRRSCSGMGATA